MTRRRARRKEGGGHHRPRTGLRPRRQLQGNEAMQSKEQHFDQTKQYVQHHCGLYVLWSSSDPTRASFVSRSDNRPLLKTLMDEWQEVRKEAGIEIGLKKFLLTSCREYSVSLMLRLDHPGGPKALFADLAESLEESEKTSTPYVVSEGRVGRTLYVGWSVEDIQSIGLDYEAAGWENEAS